MSRPDPRHVRGASGVIAALLVAGPAAALTLQDSVFQEVLYAGGSRPPVLFHDIGASEALPESFAHPLTTVADASASGHVLTLGGALPRAEGGLTFTAIGNPTRSLYASFDARVYYEWGLEQVGGEPYAGAVPVIVHAQGGVDSSATAFAEPYNLYAQAVFGPRYSGMDHAFQARGCRTGDCTFGPIGFDGSFTGQATPGEVYTVVLHAWGSGYVQADGASFTISAWADPRIEIDPGFARRDDFRIVYGAGVTPVPEPSAAALLVLGLAALAAQGRRGRADRAARTRPASPG